MGSRYASVLMVILSTLKNGRDQVASIYGTSTKYSYKKVIFVSTKKIINNLCSERKVCFAQVTRSLMIIDLLIKKFLVDYKGYISKQENDKREGEILDALLT